jgi:ABC-type antimicrobial peptide transport system permease subunit
MKAGDRIVQRVDVNSITPGYFQTMQIPLLQGRDFQDGDRTKGNPVAIINETFAKTYFKNNALNSLVYLPVPGTPPTFSPIKVVGVVSGSKYNSLGEEPAPAVYWPVAQQSRTLTLMVSTDSAPAGILGAVRQLLASLDPRAPIKIELMQERLAGALLPSKIASLLLAGIGALGLLLAAIGIYGVVAYSVGRRTAEIGVRLALGATKAHVLRLILRDATELVCIGMVAGSVLSVLVVQTLGKVLPAGMKVVDPLSFTMVGCVLTIVALAAALIPALRASHIDPNVALKCE